MTEISGIWTTGTDHDGTSTYTQANGSDFFKSIAAVCAFEGVAPSYLNALAVTGTSSPVSVNTGGAMVDGKAYLNGAAVTVAIATPVTLTRVDRIVLRADWANHQVRITKIAGTEGAGAPAITQTPGTTYDISLATVSITTGGVITVTDARTFAQIQTADIAAQAVTAAKIANATITTTQVSATAAITGSQLAAAAGITDAQLQYGKVSRRQGESGTDWETDNGGTNNYTPAATRIQIGETGAVGSGLTVTFPVAFSAKPLVFCCKGPDVSIGAFIRVSSITVSNFVVQVYQKDATTAEANAQISWIAMGPP